LQHDVAEIHDSNIFLSNIKLNKKDSTKGAKKHGTTFYLTLIFNAYNAGYNPTRKLPSKIILTYFHQL